MRKVVAFISVTLDGVMQAPGRTDEDTRGGFRHGGWAGPYADKMIQGLAGEGSTDTGAMLFGRRTWEDFHKVWANASGNPFTEILNNTEKLVASRSLKAPLPWQNSTLLDGDAVEAVRKLRSTDGKDILILGSGDLIRSLLPHGQVDRFILLIHPLVLGSGQRLFDDGTAFADLELRDTRASPSGVVVATYDVGSAKPA
jgi:dihydrofolate reductase